MVLADVDAAEQEALRFLLAARGSGRWWRDFDTLAGSSDEWVTAYVAVALLDLGTREAEDLARGAWRTLSRRGWWSGCWGYNASVPPDADSTVWALRLADGISVRGWRIERALRALGRYSNPNGSLRTYAVPGAIRRFTGVDRRISFNGWCGEHTCVTAAAAALKTFRRRVDALEYLRAAQNGDGSWTGYWWHEPAFPTALAVDALEHVEGAAKAIARAAQWATARIRMDGSVACSVHGGASAFATASCVRILAAATDGSRRSSMELAVRWLLANQRSDGGWASSAPLRIPPPDVTNPEAFSRWSLTSRGGASIRFDHRALFTTATVLSALARAHRRETAS